MYIYIYLIWRSLDIWDLRVWERVIFFSHYFSFLFSLCVLLSLCCLACITRLTWKSVCIRFLRVCCVYMNWRCCCCCCSYCWMCANVLFWAFGMFNVKVVALGRMRIWVRQTEIMCYIFAGTYSMLRANERTNERTNERMNEWKKSEFCFWCALVRWCQSILDIISGLWLCRRMSVGVGRKHSKLYKQRQ